MTESDIRGNIAVIKSCVTGEVYEDKEKLIQDAAFSLIEEFLVTQSRIHDLLEAIYGEVMEK